MQDEIKLNRILAQLEEIKREVKSMLPPPTPAPKPMPAPKAEPSITPVQKPALPASDPAPTTMERLWAKVEDWFLVRGAFAPKGVTREFAVATRWLTRAGAVLLAGAVTYFLMLAIDKGWIGPAQRVYGMMAWGIAGTAFGTWLKLKSERYAILGEVCAAVGLVAAYLSFGLGHRFFKPPVVASGYFAFAGLFAATVAAGVLSVRLRSLMIACLALAGGFLVPTICSFAHHGVQLHVYLLILSAGAAVVAYFRNWPLFGFVAVAVSALLSSAGLECRVVAYLFCVSEFAIVVFTAAWTSLRHGETARRLCWGAVAFAGVCGFYYAGYYAFVSSGALTVHRVGWGCAFAVLAVVCRRFAWGGMPGVVASSALTFLVVTVESHWFGREFLPFLRGGFVTIVWSAIASTLLTVGIVRRIRAARHVGLWLLAASVVKLLLFDTSTLATPGRVGVFAAVGVLLIAGAFLYLKFKSCFEE
jgi:uncharacterized membrane protein